MRAHSRHLKLLICLANQDFVLRALLANIDDEVTLRLSHISILPLIKLEAQTRNLPRDLFPQPRTSFSYTPREDERVHLPFEADVVAADEAGDAVDEEVEGEAVGVWGVGGGRGDGGEICGTGEGTPAGLLVEDLLGFGDV